ncbi:MAG: OmpH family outer membrane protein [Phycisphaerales bacterium]|nr:OmpH family outer membrane protein [Phycisphaerales bacterium]
MHRFERLIVHSLLAILTIAVLADFGGRGSVAIGDDAEAAKETLGPADELILRGKTGDLTLRDDDGGLAFGDDPTSRVWSIGAVNVPKLLGLLMESDRFGEDRKEIQATAETQNATFEAQFQAFQEEHAAVTPESPEFPEVQARFQAMMQEYQTWQKGTMAIQQRLGAEQIETAYRELIEAVDIVAEKRHIDIVTRFVPTSDPFKADNMDLASEQVRRRLFLRYPDAIDITEAVSAELGL